MIAEPREPFVELYPASPAVELYCPHCGYNLAGTPQDRCSECGEAFDRIALTQWTTYPAQPLPFGELAATNKEGLLGLSLFHPAKLGRLLPPRPDVEAAKGYSYAVRVVALAVPAALIIVAAAVTERSATAVPILFIPLPILLASSACEVAIAALLARGVVARSVGDGERYVLWRTLCRCFSSHLLANVSLFSLIEAVVFVHLRLSNAHRTYQAGVLLALPWLIPLGMILWWWYCLGQAIAARGAPGTARTVIIILIPLTGLAAIALGFGIGLAEVFLAASLCSGLGV